MRYAAVVLCAVLFLSSWSSAETTYDDLVRAAKERTRHDVTYDGSYFRIGYPNGDVPKNRGVCTDVIIRAYRQIGIDLQVEVHRDMQTCFQQYPKIWGLSKPDPNIDHRRVPNLQVFFQRKGMVLPASHRAEDYRPGDLVTWMLPGNLPHIGLVVDQKSEDAKRYLIVHNIGRGPRMEDALFDFPITGHYRYLPRPNRRQSGEDGDRRVSSRQAP